MVLINKPVTGGSFSTLKIILLLAVGASAFISGCKRSEAIWSAEARSPDEKMIASARAVAQSGFGINGIETYVYLNWTKGSQPPMLILDLADGSDAPSDTNVEMKWLN